MRIRQIPTPSIGKVHRHSGHGNTGLSLFIVLLALMTAAGAAYAKTLPELAEQVNSSVVNISSTQQIDASGSRPQMGRGGSMEEFFGNDFFEHFFGGRPMPRREATALGSGFIISDDGLILTNNHVVARATAIKVLLQNDREYDAVTVGTDPQTDLALIRVEPDRHFPSPARLGDSDAIKVGETVMAMGNPFGLGHTVTSGILSARGRVIGAGPYDDFLQTDAAINPGNSGGPLFNMDGEVIGINTAIVAQGQGIGFAIPINMAVDLLPQLKTGKIIRGWLGVMIQDVNQALADAMKLENTDGVLISDTVADGPADKAGLKRGDVIISIDGEAVDNAHMLSSKVAGIQPETQVEITVRRDGKKKTLPVALGTKPGEAGVAAAGRNEQRWGLGLQELTPALADRLGYDRGTKGLVVVQVEPSSPAQEADVRPGDLIKEVNRKAVSTLDEFNAAVRQSGDDDSLLLLIRRNGNAFYSVLERP